MQSRQRTHRHMTRHYGLANTGMLAVGALLATAYVLAPMAVEDRQRSAERSVRVNGVERPSALSVERRGAAAPLQGTAAPLQGADGSVNLAEKLAIDREGQPPPCKGSQPAPQPANDDCEDAFLISTTPYTSDIDTSGATSQGTDPFQGCSYNGPNQNSNTVWYTFTPPCDGVINLDTCTSNYDTVLSVYVGPCGDLTEIACDDDAGCGGGQQSALSNVTVTGGQRYYIEVSDWNLPGGGDLHFSFDYVPDCDGACCPPYACTEAINFGGNFFPSCNGYLGRCLCFATFDGDIACVDLLQECGPQCLNGVCPAGSVCVVDTGCNDNTPNCVLEGCPLDIPPERALGPGEIGLAGVLDAELVERGGVPQGGCAEVDQATCEVFDGDYQGDLTVCQDTVCPAPGACCFFDSSCIDALAEECRTLGGDPREPGTSCATTTCTSAVGACCPGVVCSATFDCSTGQPAPYACGGILGCVCMDNTEGGVSCLNGLQGCGEECPNGTASCGAGQVCVLNSCCNDGRPTCAVDGCPGPASAASTLEPGELGIVGELTPELQQRGGGGLNGCLELEEPLCLALGAEYQGDGTICLNNTCPAPGACCADTGECTLALAEECLSFGGTPRPPGTTCGPGVCELLGACCIRGECVGNSEELPCLQEGGQWFVGEDCRTFECPGEEQACCSPDGRECTIEVPSACLWLGGTPQGPGTHCLGDQNQNGIDDACETDPPCEDCGPGPHWIDQCPEGDDHMPTGALIGIDLDGDCVQDQSLRLTGPVRVHRSRPLDDSDFFPGVAPVDGHLEVIDTEIASMSLSGGGVTLIAGGGLGQIPLQRSVGTIVEQPYNPAFGDSRFHVFFEVYLGGGVYAYNQDPLLVIAKVDCLPPNTRYIHPIDCVKLYTSPIPGQGDVIAWLVTADHSTYPGCGDPVTGSCFEPHESPFCDDDACCERVCEIEPRCCTDIWQSGCAEIALEFCQTQACCEPDTGRCQDAPPDICEFKLGGIPQGFGTGCEGDGDGDGRDDACQAEEPCEDCGPGDHWIDQCREGTDQMSTGALIGIDTNFDCSEDTTVRLNGPINVSRSDPRDDSANFPGLAPLDGHFEVLDTEILSMHLSSGGMTMIAGGGLGQANLLRRSLGAIVEQRGDVRLGDSFFDVFFEFDLGGGNYVYNHAPLRVSAKIDCVPPDTTYIHPFDCIPLFNSPYPGVGDVVAQLVRADHSTNPKCGDPGTGDCFQPNNTPYCEDERCCLDVCEQLPRCCGAAAPPQVVGWDLQCVAAAQKICIPLQACCLPGGGCVDERPDICVQLEGGVPQGVGTACEGDADHNGIDDACQVEEPCEDCGPGPHWIDQCGPGNDQMSTGALIGIDLTGDCVQDTTVRLNGPVNVGRSAPRDDSQYFPGLAPLDGHLEVLDTEILSLQMTGGGMTMIAGGGLGQGTALRRSLGAIVEQPAEPRLGDSFFDVFFEFDLGGGNYVYNHDPLRVTTKIDCVPPDTTYFHPFDCIRLYNSPFPGTGDIVARLVRADHSTHPECGDPTTGDCFEPNDSPYCDHEDCCRRVCEMEPRCCQEVWAQACADIAHEICLEACCVPDGRCDEMPPEVCEDKFGGVPQGYGTRCEGDSNGNDIDDACEPDEPCELCGPGEHWVDQCPGGVDNMPSAALVGLDMNFDCLPDTSLRLTGPVTVQRFNPRDDSMRFPGTRAIDGHLDVLDTEILSMVLTRSGITLRAGAGQGQGGVLWPSYGVIAEQRGDNTMADTFFNVFFEVDLGGNVYAYNHEPLRVDSKIDCLPPDTRYIHPTGCIPLYNVPPRSPVKPRIVANLVTADHSTFPARIIRANPEDEHSLWRSEHNVVRIWFDDDITRPGPGQIRIREMLPLGAFGPDLSNRFTFTVENDGGGQPRVLRIWEDALNTLDHRNWYSVANVGCWSGVSPFELEYVVQVGDASNDARVLAFDVSVINTGIPCFDCPDDDRRDMNGDNRVLAFDVSITNGSIPSFNVPKPSGHP